MWWYGITHLEGRGRDAACHATGHPLRERRVGRQARPVWARTVVKACATEWGRARHASKRKGCLGAPAFSGTGQGTSVLPMFCGGRDTRCGGHVKLCHTRVAVPADTCLPRATAEPPRSINLRCCDPSQTRTRWPLPVALRQLPSPNPLLTTHRPPSAREHSHGFKWAVLRCGSSSADSES